MIDNFNKNKKNMNGNNISYTTYRTNYSNDEMTKNNGCMPNVNKEEITIKGNSYVSAFISENSYFILYDENFNFLNSLDNLDDVTFIFYISYSNPNFYYRTETSPLYSNEGTKCYAFKINNTTRLLQYYSDDEDEWLPITDESVDNFTFSSDTLKLIDLPILYQYS